LGSAWQEALSADRPVVLEVKTDPEIVPLPPHVTLKEARGFMSAMAKGDSGADRIIGDTAKQVVDGLLGKKT
jgi:pyruvate dehydrogenase (quinone)